MFFMRDTRMKMTHCCADCGEVMAVHEHSSWQEIKDCDRNPRALCDGGAGRIPAPHGGDARGRSKTGSKEEWKLKPLKLVLAARAFPSARRSRDASPTAS